MNEVRVGIGLIVVRGDKVLAGRRKGSHAAGLISFPGGHLDFNETWEECCLRELEEECGPNFKAVVRRFSDLRSEFFVTNDIMPDCGKHYITIFMVADWVSGEAENMEPHKCEGWEWITAEELKQHVVSGGCASWIPMDQFEFYKDQIFKAR